ncbi:hypothetical protein O181_062261 [Austropuccinia psidii MF-1]|uniref:Uncharacterized protein n=1 Tax=Austropuccinia psidii MF-1 TaxID=1389203 RepID=A0A9Q3EPF1_9BASI|nr:hypothetical protein [Austropuccinia psidii MF-1]
MIQLRIPISRINAEGMVKQIRQIVDSPPYQDAEGSDELDGEEVEVVPNSATHPSNNSPSHPPAEITKSHHAQYPQKFPSHSCYHSSCLPKFFPHQSFLESISKTIPHPTAQRLTHSHLTTTEACGQYKLKKRRTFSLAVSCPSSVSAQGLLAYPSYQRRSKYSE